MDESFESVVREHRPRVEAFCRHVLDDPQDALDATDDTFLKVKQYLPRYSAQQPLGDWIDRIAAATCRDLLRSRQRQSETDGARVRSALRPHRERDGERVVGYL
jgi:DNA-directed RNA polymerase specialized sigma24 family protein